MPVTSPDVIISDLTFYVIGTKSGCDGGAPGPTCAPIQPHVIVVIRGSAGTGKRTTPNPFVTRGAALGRGPALSAIEAAAKVALEEAVKL